MAMATPRLRLIIKALVSRSHVFLSLSEYNRALADLDKIEELIGQRRYAFMTRAWNEQRFHVELGVDDADIKIRRAWIYKTRGEMRLAIRYCKMGLAQSRRLWKLLHRHRAGGNSLKQDAIAQLLKRLGSISAGGYNALGTVYADRGRYKEAIRYLMRSLAMSRRQNDRDMMGVVTNNLGFVYDNIGDYDRAIKFHKLALALTAASGDRTNLGMANNNLGYVYYMKCEYEKAVEYYQRYLQISLEIGSRLGKALAMNNLGGAYLQTGDHAQALSHLKEAEQIFIDIGDKYTLVETYLFLAELLVKDNGSTPDRADRLRGAVVYARKAQRLAQMLGSTYRLACCCLTRARIYAAEGNLKRAMQSYARTISLFESINQNRDLIDAYLECARLIGSMPANRMNKRLLETQSRCHTRARSLCKKIGLNRLLGKQQTQ
jgi:tetratricopeptide (TPR) repeat protein